MDVCALVQRATLRPLIYPGCVCTSPACHLETPHLSLRIDNSRRGAIHVLCDISRTKIAMTSCDRSKERAYFSANVGANGILMKFDLKKRQF